MREEDALRFLRICSEEAARTGPSAGGVGTLNEKRMHRIFKKYVCPDAERFEEVPMGRGFTADIFDGERVYEIQTGSLYPLKARLGYYTRELGLPVTVVCPVALCRRIIRIDPVSGVSSPPRMSPKKESITSLLPKAVYIAEYLNEGLVELRTLCVEEEEYRIIEASPKNPKRRMSSRYEILPSKLAEDRTYRSPEELRGVMPEGLPEEFTAPVFASAGKFRGRDTYRALRAAELLGFIEKQKDRKSGRAFLYRTILS